MSERYNPQTAQPTAQPHVTGTSPGITPVKWRTRVLALGTNQGPTIHPTLLQKIKFILDYELYLSVKNKFIISAKYLFI